MTGTQGDPAENDRDGDRPISGDGAAERGKPPPGDGGEAGPAGEPEPIDLDSVRDRAS